MPNYELDSNFIEAVAKLTGLSAVKIDQDLTAHGDDHLSFCQNLTYRTLPPVIDFAKFVQEYENDPDLVDDQDEDSNYKLTTVAGVLIHLGIGLLRINAVKTNKATETENVAKQVQDLLNNILFK